ncbi:MAG: hypothetical protein RL087_2005, partial [Pseudomonadota bacterium]
MLSRYLPPLAVALLPALLGLPVLAVLA